MLLFLFTLQYPEGRDPVLVLGLYLSCSRLCSLEGSSGCTIPSPLGLLLYILHCPAALTA